MIQSTQSLAGEANNPGTFSKRTIGFLGDLEKSEANLFTRLCGFVWTISTLAPMIFS
ncbi:MAG: DUF2806 domain-containing protein, partial [Planctomycetes bacterium]|nr:DUF2806 domain-containing protein [Planctomycetota bacterium]